MMNRELELSIGEFDQSIIELQKRKFKLLKEVEPVSYTHLTLPTNREV